MVVKYFNIPFVAAAGAVTTVNHDDISKGAILFYASVGTGSISPIQKAKIFMIEIDSGAGFELETKTSMQRSSQAGFASNTTKDNIPIPLERPRLQARVYNYYKSDLNCAFIGAYEQS